MFMKWITKRKPMDNIFFKWDKNLKQYFKSINIKNVPYFKNFWLLKNQKSGNISFHQIAFSIL